MITVAHKIEMQTPGQKISCKKRVVVIHEPGAPQARIGIYLTFKPQGTRQEIEFISNVARKIAAFIRTNHIAFDLHLQ